MEARLFIGGNYVYWIILFYGGSGKGSILVQSMNRIAKFNRKRITPGIILYNIKQGNFTIYPVENMDNYFNDYSLQQIVEVDSLSFQKSLIELFNRIENRKLVEDLSKAQFLEYRP